MSYRVTEPHPTALPNRKIHTGRGGAGNTYRTPQAASRNSTSRLPSLDRVPTSLSQASTAAKFSSGRGGAGNILPVSKAAVYDFEDELSQKVTRERRTSSSAWHVGRGGAGNYKVDQSESAARKMSNESTSSNGSIRQSGFFRRISGAFDRE